VDYENTSGLAPDKSTPPMVAFWSRFDNHGQCISYSLDHGRTWKLYAGNPIFDHPNRDPKVFWHGPSKHWVMMLYGDDQYHVLTSENLLSWKDEHHPIPQCFECPDLFELPVDTQKGITKWVLVQGSGKYSIGSFDGTAFKEESERLDCDIGPNFYATQTWANTQTGDGRRIQAAWMRGGNYPDMPFNQQVTFPRELTLRTTPKGLRLFREPIREIESLQKTPQTRTDRTLKSGETLMLESSGDLFPAGASLTFVIRGERVIFTSAAIESGTAHGPVQDRVKAIELLIDRTSIEAFVNHGEVSTSRCVLPRENGVSVVAAGGDVVIHSLILYPLESMWSKSK